MQETFIVTVTTEDGKCLIQEKTTGDYLDLSSHLSRLSNLFSYRLGFSNGQEIGPHSGTGPSVLDSSSPMGS